MSSRQVDLDVDRQTDVVVVRWSAGAASGRVRFERIEGAVPGWLASGDDLLAGAQRRYESSVLAAVTEWAESTGEDFGLWWDDGGVELLG